MLTKPKRLIVTFDEYTYYWLVEKPFCISFSNEFQIQSKVHLKFIRINVDCHQVTRFFSFIVLEKFFTVKTKTFHKLYFNCQLHSNCIIKLTGFDFSFKNWTETTKIIEKISIAGYRVPCNVKSSFFGYIRDAIRKFFRPIYFAREKRGTYRMGQRLSCKSWFYHFYPFYYMEWWENLRCFSIYISCF